MKLKFLALAFSAVFSGCSTFVPVLGSSRGWGDASEVKVLQDLSVSGLRVRVTTPSTNTQCANGLHHTVEINGPINKDTSFVLRRILSELPKCVSNEGKTLVTTIYLNSGGGTLDDGYALGRIFREAGVSTNVIQGQVCASSCAVAFLGGEFRNVLHDGKLIFHAPYRINYLGNLACAEKSDAESLRSYYRQMISRDAADRLFERTMNYCSREDGWTLDQGAAKIFGILR